MMQASGAAQYRAVSNHGLVADASPVRLVQIMYEEVLTQLAIAQGCMARIQRQPALAARSWPRAKPWARPSASSTSSTVTLDMERGAEIAANLRSLYVYMLARLTLANATNWMARSSAK